MENWTFIRQSGNCNDMRELRKAEINPIIIYEYSDQGGRRMGDSVKTEKELQVGTQVDFRL